VDRGERNHIKEEEDRELVKGEIWRRAKSKEVKCNNFMKE